MLRSDLCDYSDAYVWVKTMNHLFHAFQRFSRKLVENVEDLNIVMPRYNLLEYSKNYEKTSGSLFNYYRDEPGEITIGASNNAINISIRNSKSFDYKTEITGSLDAGEDEKEDVAIAIPLKYLGNF